MRRDYLYSVTGEQSAGTAHCRSGGLAGRILLLTV
jgi:hypothetical protein